MEMIVGWLTSKIAGPIAAGLAILFAVGFAWQTAAIDGWPIFGGGYKSQVAILTLRAAQAETAQAKFTADAEKARADRDAALRDRQDKIAAAYQDGLNHSPTTTIIQKVPVYVSAKSDSACVVPWGVIRLFDAAASGSDPGIVTAAVAPGQPDDGASPFHLSDLVAVYAKNLGAGRDNADQLSALQGAIEAEHK